MQTRLYLIIIVVFLGFGTRAKAQMVLIAEYNNAEINTTGLNGFVNSFNGFWGNKLSSPYEEYEASTFSMPNYGLGFRFSSEDSGFGFTASTHALYGRKSDSHTAKWQTNVVNDLTTRLRDIRWNLTLGAHYNNLIFLEGFMGGTFRKISMRHYTEYPDGSRSLSTEYKLNGLYTGTTTAIDLGIQASIKISRFMVYVRYTNPMKNFPPAKNLVALIDYNSTNFPPTDFPADYRIYATDPIAFVEQDLGLKTDNFEGKRLTLGSEISLHRRAKNN